MSTAALLEKEVKRLRKMMPLGRIADYERIEREHGKGFSEAVRREIEKPR